MAMVRMSAVMSTLPRAARRERDGDANFMGGAGLGGSAGDARSVDFFVTHDAAGRDQLAGRAAFGRVAAGEIEIDLNHLGRSPRRPRRRSQRPLQPGDPTRPETE